MFAGNGKYIPPPLRIYAGIRFRKSAILERAEKHFCKDEICGTEMKR